MGNTMPAGTYLPTQPMCGPPPEVSNASVGVFHDVANYTCDDGYVMEGIPNNVTCIFGAWLGNPPNCTLPTVLDIDPNTFFENVPLWLALTLAAVGTCAGLLLACCCVALCCFGNKRKKQKEDFEELLENPKVCCCLRHKKVLPQPSESHIPKPDKIITVQEMSSGDTSFPKPVSRKKVRVNSLTPV